MAGTGTDVVVGMEGILSHPDLNDEVTAKLLELKQQAEMTTGLLSTFEMQKQEYLNKCLERQTIEELIKLNGANPDPVTPFETNFAAQLEGLDYEMQQRLSSLLEFANNLEGRLEVNVRDLSLFKTTYVDDQLTSWKYAQLWGPEVSSEVSLDKLQIWCEDLATLINLSRDHLRKVELLKQNTPFIPQIQSISLSRLDLLQEKVKDIYTNLVASSFVIEIGPPQVIKMKTNFSASVRLLLGSHLSIHRKPPQVKVGIISASHAQALLDKTTRHRTYKTCGNILQNTQTMKHCEEKRRTTASFENLNLQKIERSDKPAMTSKVSVVDEKFCLCFEAHFEEQGLEFNIWALSYPVVVTVHSDQNPGAWATILWDNAFAEVDRTPFQVPDKVSWVRVFQALSDEFKSTNGRGIPEECHVFLGEKLFGASNFDRYDFCTWPKFCKEVLPGHKFTFWEWFYAAMKLTRDYFPGPWKDGSIHGFVSRQQAEAWLSNCYPGTFLLRFSDSVLGGIAVTWIHSDGKVYSLAPYTAADFEKLCLAKQIIHLDPKLLYLYPQIPTETAFMPYYDYKAKVPKKDAVSPAWNYVGVDLFPKMQPIHDSTGRISSPVNGIGAMGTAILPQTSALLTPESAQSPTPSFSSNSSFSFNLGDGRLPGFSDSFDDILGMSMNCEGSPNNMFQSFPDPQ